MAKNAFTLIELLIVIIIVGILAAVTVPIMQEITKKAIASEAITALRTVLTAEKAFYLENDKYTLYYSDLDLNLSDLDGTYFSRECYTQGKTDVLWVGWRGTGAQNDVLIFCTLYQTTAPRGDLVKKWMDRFDDVVIRWGRYIAMDEKGNIYSDIPELGYSRVPNYGEDQ